MGPGGFRRLQNDCDLTTSGWVGSIPTRSRHGAQSTDRFTKSVSAMTAPRNRSFSILAVLCVAMATPAWAQRVDSTVAGPRRVPATPMVATQVVRDSTKPPISPGRAFLYSLALPGLGQSQLHRAGGGAFYFLFEGFAAAMATKALFDLRIAKEHRQDVIVTAYTTDVNGNPVVADTARNRYAANRVKARRTHVEDWVAALIFNHLFSGADAYVSAHLWDLPIQLGFRAAPAVAILRAASRY